MSINMFWHKKLEFYAVSLCGRIETFKVKVVTKIVSVNAEVRIYNMSVTHAYTSVCMYVKSSLTRWI